MKNVKMIVEYDGTDFHGWQKQPGMRTIQGVLEDAAEKLFRTRVAVDGCCRTDAGVHAWGYCAGIRVDTGLSPLQIRRALSSDLPADVVVKHVEEMPADFHPRHSCTARRYNYKITTSRSAVMRHILAYTKYPLDLERMQKAAAAFVGEKDFTSFAPIGLDEGVSPVCRVMETSLVREGAVFSFDIKADRFLHHMVRNIVGTLIEVGRGRFEPEQIEEILCKKDRRAAGPTAPACGLALTEAYYGDR